MLGCLFGQLAFRFTIHLKMIVYIRSIYIYIIYIYIFIHFTVYSIDRLHIHIYIHTCVRYNFSCYVMADNGMYVQSTCKSYPPLRDAAATGGCYPDRLISVIPNLYYYAAAWFRDVSCQCSKILSGR